ncbi:hypothetical protein A3K81_01555 [Candidatus Bathyarchaeota archaeon RBG_13_60_20]|nr:MAG: hypothetical protein A3K81_01555 [Candidatus Bathyarchaeota archaeon RBG_13_60_20]
MPIPKGVARFNKHFTNRFFLIFAGRMPPFAIVSHRGRRSGRGYRTPVLAFPTETGFVFALTYGRDVDWARNLVALGGGSLVHKGEEIPLCGVRLVKYGDVRGMFPLWIRLSLWFISLEDCLLAEVC